MLANRDGTEVPAFPSRLLLAASLALLLAACGGGSGGALPPIQPVATSCALLAGTKVPDTTFSAAEEVTSGKFVPPSGAVIADLPSFCRLAATIKPTAESDIKVELWMPKAWNGKYLGTGNGGMAGKIDYEALANGVRRGYAVAYTDLGTSGGIETMVGRMEKIVDFGHRATHKRSAGVYMILPVAGSNCGCTGTPSIAI